MLTREHFLISGYDSTDPMVEVDALVDPGQMELTIPRRMSDAFGFQTVDTRYLGGERYDYVGAVHIEGRDTETCSGAVVKGDEVVMGWLPLSSLVKIVKTQGVCGHQEAAE